MPDAGPHPHTVLTVPSFPELHDQISRLRERLDHLLDRLDTLEAHNTSSLAPPSMSSPPPRLDSQRRMRSVLRRIRENEGSPSQVATAPDPSSTVPPPSRRRAQPSERFQRLGEQRQRRVERMEGTNGDGIVELQEASERLAQSNEDLRNLLERPRAGSELAMERTSNNEGERRRKRRRTAGIQPEETLTKVEYGYHGQIDSGQLVMEVVGSDAGSTGTDQPSAGWSHPGALCGTGNILRPDRSVFNVGKRRCNIVLRHPGGRIFTIDKLTIKTPKGCLRSPMLEGLVFVSMKRDETFDRTNHYQVHHYPTSRFGPRSKQVAAHQSRSDEILPPPPQAHNFTHSHGNELVAVVGHDGQVSWQEESTLDGPEPYADLDSESLDGSSTTSSTSSDSEDYEDEFPNLVAPPNVNAVLPRPASDLENMLAQQDFDEILRRGDVTAQDRRRRRRDLARQRAQQRTRMQQNAAEAGQGAPSRTVLYEHRESLRQEHDGQQNETASASTDDADAGNALPTGYQQLERSMQHLSEVLRERGALSRPQSDGTPTNAAPADASSSSVAQETERATEPVPPAIDPSESSSSLARLDAGLRYTYASPNQLGLVSLEQQPAVLRVLRDRAGIQSEVELVSLIGEMCDLLREFGAQYLQIRNAALYDADRRDANENSEEADLRRHIVRAQGFLDAIVEYASDPGRGQESSIVNNSRGVPLMEQLGQQVEDLRAQRDRLLPRTNRITQEENRRTERDIFQQQERDRRRLLARAEERVEQLMNPIHSRMELPNLPGIQGSDQRGQDAQSDAHDRRSGPIASGGVDPGSVPASSTGYLGSDLPDAPSPPHPQAQHDHDNNDATSDLPDEEDRILTQSRSLVDTALATATAEADDDDKDEEIGLNTDFELLPPTASFVLDAASSPNARARSQSQNPNIAKPDPHNPDPTADMPSPSETCFPSLTSSLSTPLHPNIHTHAHRSGASGETITLTFSPPVSGRYILLKLWKSNNTTTTLAHNSAYTGARQQRRGSSRGAQAALLGAAGVPERWIVDEPSQHSAPRGTRIPIERDAAGRVRRTFDLDAYGAERQRAGRAARAAHDAQIRATGASQPQTMSAQTGGVPAPSALSERQLETFQRQREVYQLQQEEIQQHRVGVRREYAVPRREYAVPFSPDVDPDMMIGAGADAFRGRVDGMRSRGADVVLESVKVRGWCGPRWFPVSEMV